MASMVPEPMAPDITRRMLIEQIKLDVQGKEVQRAATYSYTWLADQVGHICVGILLSFVFTAIVSLLARNGWLPAWLSWFVADAGAAGFILALLTVSVWEYGAYRLEIRSAQGPFPLDRKLLAKNAFIATAYMVLGAGLGWAFHLPSDVHVLVAVGLAALAAVLPVSFWLRQKIVWQKAGLPYLFRLANAHHNLHRKDAETMHRIVSTAAPPAKPPQRIVIAGPVNSGRTSFASGVGTEFAFRGCSVRYLSFDRLVEFATETNLSAQPQVFCDETGPVNVSFWPWRQVQVLIIDDISPLLHAAANGNHHDHFREILFERLAGIRGCLAMKHTVWILGDLDDDGLDGFAETIAEFCDPSDAADDRLTKVLLNQRRDVKIKVGRRPRTVAEPTSVY